MANGNILVVYVRPSTVYSVKGAKPEPEHIINYYRVLEYRLEGSDYKRINAYRFKNRRGNSRLLVSEMKVPLITNMRIIVFSQEY